MVHAFCYTTEPSCAISTHIIPQHESRMLDETPSSGDVSGLHGDWTVVYKAKDHVAGVKLF